MKISTVLKYASDLDGWARADEMKGSMHPDHRDYIHEQYKLARGRLRRAIRTLAGQPRASRSDDVYLRLPVSEFLLQPQAKKGQRVDPTSDIEFLYSDENIRILKLDDARHGTTVRVDIYHD